MAAARAFSVIAGAVEPSASAKWPMDRIGSRSGAMFAPDWTDRDDVELVMFHNWGVTVGRIASVDGHQVSLKSPTCAPDSWAGLPKGNRFFAENVKDALGSPGEWYLDRNTGVLTYVPLPGETPSNTHIVAPFAPCLLEVRGNPEARRWAANLRVSGLTFRHTVWNIPVLGRSFPQAEADLGGAIRLSGARDVSFDRCTVTQVGEYGIEVGASCKNVRVTNSYSYRQAGAGGIKIGADRPGRGWRASWIFGLRGWRTTRSSGLSAGACRGGGGS